MNPICYFCKREPSVQACEICKRSTCIQCSDCHNCYPRESFSKSPQKASFSFLSYFFLSFFAFISLMNLHPAFGDPAKDLESNADADIQQIEDARKALNEKTQDLSQLNPLAPSSETAPPSPSKLPAQLKWVEEYLQSPWIQERAKKVTILIQNPQFQQDINEIKNFQDFQSLSISLGLFFIFYLVIKSKVLSLIKFFLVRTLARIVFFYAFWIGNGIILSYYLKTPFTHNLMAFYEILKP